MKKKKILAVVLAATLTFGTIAFSGCRDKDKDTAQTPTTESVQTTNDNMTMTDQGGNGIQMLSVVIDPSEYADYGVTESAESAHLVTASYPAGEYVSNTAVDWTAEYLEDPRPEGLKKCFPVSENISDHVIITPSCDGALTAVIACVSPFSVAIRVTVTSRQSPNLSDSLVRSYGGAIQGVHNNIVIDDAVAATCGKSGLTEGSHCEDCGLTVVPQTETDALIHQELILQKNGANCFTNICKNCFSRMAEFTTNSFDSPEKFEFVSYNPDVEYCENPIYRVYHGSENYYSSAPMLNFDAVITTAKGEVFETDEMVACRMVGENGSDIRESQRIYLEVGFKSTEFQNIYSSDDIFYVNAVCLLMSSDGYYYFSFLNEAADVGTADPTVGAKISVVGLSENQSLDIEVLTGLIDE